MDDGRLNSEKSRVLIVAPLRYVASIPFMMEGLNYLSKRGCIVELVVPIKVDPPLRIGWERVNVTEIPYGSKSFSSKLCFLWRYVTATRKLLAEDNIEVVAGLSQVGIIIAAIASIGTKAKLVYLNDELWFNDYESSLLYYPLKCLEKISNRHAKLTITQDKYRGRLLSVINGIDRKNMCYLPNSRSGKGRLQRSTLLHDIIGCSRDTKIVLWNGAASEGDGATEMAKEAIHWPESYLFVYHFRSKGLSKYKRQLIDMHGVGRNYHISNDFDYFDLERVFASAHIGIAHYPDKGINSRYIASSSGKLNSFLKVGVPCVVSRLPGLLWVENSGAGVVIDAPMEITGAVKKIDASYANFCDSALSIFNETLQFDASFQHILAEIDVR